MDKNLNYGNWVSKRMLHLLTAISLMLIFLSILSFYRFTFAKNCSQNLLFVIQSILLIASITFLLLTIYMYICHYLFSYNGLKISSKILDYVLTHLSWDGKGALLDIGCGSGALTIKAAKKYTDSTIVGIDYWGPIWNFAQNQCEYNANLEKVNSRITFMKGDAASLPFPNNHFDAAISNFVFHEVKSQPDKRLVVKEALRTIKKGGAFAFHDLFLEKNWYGDIDEFIDELKLEGISQINFVKSCNENFIPKVLKTPFMLGKIGLIYGIK